MRELITGQHSFDDSKHQRNHNDFSGPEEKRNADKNWKELERTRFLMIFSQKNKYYYYSWNMGSSLDLPSDIIKFSPKANGNMLEALQVVYFTNATIANEVTDLQKPLGRYWVDYSSRTAQTQQREVVNQLRQVEMQNSLENDRTLRENTQLVNQDFLRQLYFLRFCYEQLPSNGTIFTDFQQKDLNFITTDLHGTIRAEVELKGVQCETNRNDRKQEDAEIILKKNKQYLSKQICNFKTIPSGELHKLGYFSSGEYARLVMLSRLYWYFRGQYLCNKEQGKELEALFSGDENYFGSTIILIDEGELYYHPEWQRCFLSSLLDLINACFSIDRQGEMKLQLLLTSNSPFVLTDLPKPCVKLLSTEKADIQETFSQNIYTLISDSFFLGDVTGSFATKKINEARKWLQKVEAPELTQEETESLRNQVMAMEDLIHRIGEPVVRNALLRKYYAVTPRLDRVIKDKFKQLPPEYHEDFFSYIKAFLDNKIQSEK